MMTVLLCLFAFGAVFIALLESAASDYTCILEQLRVVSPDRFFSEPDVICKNIDKRFENVNKELKNCSQHVINTQKMEALFREFCADNSVFKREIEGVKRCVSSIESSGCISNSIQPPKIEPRSSQEYCLRVSTNTYTCMINKYGKPCGRAGVKVIEHFIDAFMPFVTGMCYEVVEAALPGSHRRESGKGGVLVNSALMLLFCVLLTMEWNRSIICC